MTSAITDPMENSRPAPGPTEATAPSPLTGKPGTLLRSLSREFLLSELGQYYRTLAPDWLVPCDYDLYRCEDSGLEYAWPLHPASEDFYTWCVKSGGYYPAHRWEWDKVVQLTGNARILDVGCGDGKFLAFAHQRAINNIVGLDFCEESVAVCRAKGFEAYAQSVQGAIATDRIAAHSFDFVVSFHCLEHVPDPLGFVREMTTALKPGGTLLISTPCSPMSFESDFFDVMNHPPHHMGRWNEKTYQSLAERLGLHAKSHFSEAGSPARRAIRTFRLAMGRRGGRSVKLLGDICLHPIKFLRCMQNQRSRRRVGELTIGDIILVELFRK